MHLAVPSYTFPTDRLPTSGAIAYVAYVGADTWDFSSGRIHVWLFRSLEDFNAEPYLPPADQFDVLPGEVLVPAAAGDPDASPPVAPVAAVLMPSIEQLDDEAGAIIRATPALTPIQALGLAICNHLVDHPKLAGATVVTT